MNTSAAEPSGKLGGLWSEHFAGFFNNVRGDLFGGLTAGIVALPLALGFGVASGLDGLSVAGVPLNGALAGLIGAIVVGFIAALLGGTLSQVSGPTGPMTVVVAGMVTAATGDPRWLFVAFALAGLFQIVLGLLKVGRNIKYIPYPVISGFMTGIGVIIVVIQLPQVLGAPAVGSPMGALKSLPAAVQNIQMTTFLLALGTIAVIYLVPRITKVVPGTLVALVIGTGVAWAFGLDVGRLGEMPSGRPTVALPDAMDWSMISVVIGPALVLALLASIDSLLTSLVADQITRTKHDSERELIGQGIGNIVAGLFGGLPGAGATMRTVVNVRSGGSGRLAGMTHSMFLLAVLLGLGPIAAQIPHAVLAGILVTVGIGILDYRGLSHLMKVPRGDAVVMVATLVLTVTVDLVTAVGIGLVMASILLMKRFADEDPATHTALQGDRKAGVDANDETISHEMVDGIHVAHLQGAIFFGNAGALRSRLATLFDERGVVLDMTKVRYIDQSGAYALAELVDDLEKQGKNTTVVLSCLAEEPAAALERLGIAPGKIPPEHLVATVSEGIAAAVDEAARREGKTAPGKRSAGHVAAAVEGLTAA